MSKIMNPTDTRRAQLDALRPVAILLEPIALESGDASKFLFRVEDGSLSPEGKALAADACKHADQAVKTLTDMLDVYSFEPDELGRELIYTLDEIRVFYLALQGLLNGGGGAQAAQIPGIDSIYDMANRSWKSLMDESAASQLREV